MAESLAGGIDKVLEMTSFSRDKITKLFGAQALKMLEGKGMVAKELNPMVRVVGRPK